ncbi:MAG: diguanylate cyclase, partial [Calditrichia bacterium]
MVIKQAHLNRQNQETETEKRLRTILNTAIDSIICIDSHGIIDLCNPGAEQMFGYTVDEMIGQNISMLMPEPYGNEHDEYIARYERTGEKRIIGIGKEIIAKRKNGEIFEVELLISEGEVNGCPMYTGFIRDMTRKNKSEQQVEIYKEYLKNLLEVKANKLAEANKKLEELVKFDGLTHIANRRHFDEVLENEIRRAARNESKISLLMCDIDQFKLYNDHYGHVSGDECLQKIAECFENIFKRSIDLPARYGGEEFAVI